jgi:hypothetical protein
MPNGVSFGSASAPPGHGSAPRRHRTQSRYGGSNLHLQRRLHRHAAPRMTHGRLGGGSGRSASSYGSIARQFRKPTPATRKLCRCALGALRREDKLNNTPQEGRLSGRYSTGVSALCVPNSEWTRDPGSCRGLGRNIVHYSGFILNLWENVTVEFTDATLGCFSFLEATSGCKSKPCHRLVVPGLPGKENCRFLCFLSLY